MKYNMKPLRKMIAKAYGFYGNFAAYMGNSEDRCCDLVFGIKAWTQDEIEKAVALLNIPNNMIQPLFFTLAV